jgi:serine/threonine protein kinase
MVGTLVYMAPELLRREASTTASDVYSLAISLNQMLTQCIPYSDVRCSSCKHADRLQPAGSGVLHQGRAAAARQSPRSPKGAC